MKKMLKKPLFMFILGALIFGSIGVVAGTINANDIQYDTTHTVKDKLDDLYDKVAAGAYKYIGFSYGGKNETSSTSPSSFTLSKAVTESGKYLAVVSLADRNDGAQSNASRGTFSGCNNIVSNIPTFTNSYYQTTSTRANLFINIYSCTVDEPTTLKFVHMTNGDDVNATMVVFKVD